MEENKQKTTKENLSIDLNNIHLKVYNKIALWNNEDCDATEKGKRLKFVAHEVIQDVLDDVFVQLDVQTSTGTVSSIKPSKFKKKLEEMQKMQEQNSGGSPAFPEKD